jgi:CRISPR-associated protein Csm4
MVELKVHRLTFHGGLHVGRRGVNLEEHSVQVSSGTLFAALVAVYRRMGEKPQDFVAPFLTGEPPFLLSSAFPFAGDVHFFPLPVPLARWLTPETLKERRKDLNRVRFVSEAIFRRMVAGEALDDWLFPSSKTVESDQGVALQKGIFWLTAEEIAGLPVALQRSRGKRHALRQLAVYGADKVPRVTVDRLASASEIFHTGRVRFAPGCGLWFGTEWRRPEEQIEGAALSYQEAFQRTLFLLGEDGLGGERSVGYGVFKVANDHTLALPASQEGAPLLLLSRYHPREEDLPQTLVGETAAYTLVPKGGWVQSWDGPAKRRKRIWLLAEGSVIEPQGAGPWGDVVDVRPASGFAHPVWRYGLALGTTLQGGGQ